MVFPLGEWLLFSLGIMSYMEWHFLHLERHLKILPLAWIFGWIVENIFLQHGLWHWHFSRLFVILCFLGIAWMRTPNRKLLPIFLVGFTLLGVDLFLVNEPGIFPYDQWVFASLLMCIAYFSARNLWEMALGIAGGMLLNLGFSVFLFGGIVRHFDLPDPFLWHFGIAALTGIAGLTQILSRVRTKQTIT
jgi:hypothetical protein